MKKRLLAGLSSLAFLTPVFAELTEANVTDSGLYGILVETGKGLGSFLNSIALPLAIILIVLAIATMILVFFGGIGKRIGGAVGKR